MLIFFTFFWYPFSICLFFSDKFLYIFLLLYSLFLSFPSLDNYLYFLFALSIILYYSHNTLLLDLIVFVYFVDNKYLFSSDIYTVKKNYNPLFSVKSEFFIIFIASSLLMYQK